MKSPGANAASLPIYTRVRKSTNNSRSLFADETMLKIASMRDCEKGKTDY